MDKVLRPDRLDVDPGSSTATDEFNYWLTTFRHFLAALTARDLEHDRLQVLINLVSSRVFKHIAGIEE